MVAPANGSRLNRERRKRHVSFDLMRRVPFDGSSGVFGGFQITGNTVDLFSIQLDSLDQFRHRLKDPLAFDGFQVFDEALLKGGVHRFFRRTLNTSTRSTVPVCIPSRIARAKPMSSTASGTARNRVSGTGFVASEAR